MELFSGLACVVMPCVIICLSVRTALMCQSHCDPGAVKNIKQHGNCQWGLFMDVGNPRQVGHTKKG